MAEARRAGRVRAPGFPEGAEWLNAGRPLRLSALRGKVVLLDFWTYCCINCMHVLPELKRLEAKFPRELVVVGVHSAKFPNERLSENIRQAILRYNIAHPVLNDHQFQLWRQFGVRAWPTLVLIDPEGYVVGGVSGEGNYPVLERAIGELVEEARRKGTLDPAPLDLEAEAPAAGVLAYPGKVEADGEGGRLFVADSNHNRILVCTLEGEVRALIGSGEEGWRDGGFEEARFRQPQGMALVGESLFIADTENHLLRRADLERGRVETVAGTGEQARPTHPGGPGLRTPLSSPWDLAAADGALFIAMAGSHQVWRFDLKDGLARPHAGSGREARVDGPLADAALAQPSGIARDGKALYVADSEVSAIRRASVEPEGGVETLVGVDLFEFGDADGQGEAVRLQHPLGVACGGGKVYVADTYNHKIKILYPGLRACNSWLGTGRPGLEDGEPGWLYEPGGLSVARDQVFIADTNNHAVRVAPLSGGGLRTLEVRGG